MNKRLLFSGLCLFSILGIALYSQNLKIARAASFTAEKTLVLYDAASGTIPSESLMDFTDFPPGAASQTYADSTTVMDTTASGSDTFAGWVSGQAITPEFPILDRTAGAQVNFTLQVESESHDRNHRAGFSIIVLDQDAKGIELSFWENEIWAQNDDATGGLFTHGEGIAFATTAGFVEYQVSIVGDTYILTANSQPLLSGPVRDYSTFEGFPDPYETPNFLFLGDDTTAAQARVRLQFVSVSGMEPVPPPVINTSTSTSSPLPTASVTAPPGVIPTSTATPVPTTDKGSQLCSSGWLLPAVAIIGVIKMRKFRRRVDEC